MRVRSQSLILIAGIAAMPLLVIAVVLTVARINFLSREAERFSQMKTGGEDAAVEVARIFEGKPDKFRFAIAGPDGRVVHSSIPEFPLGSDLAKGLLEAAAAPPGDRFLTFGFMPPLPEGYRAVTSVPREIFLPSRAAIATFVSILAATILFAAAMSIAIVRSIASSILALEEATRRVAAGELDLPIEAAGASEFASLARSLYSLRAQIKEDQARRARLIMGISHDLKTPLALIKGYAEALDGELGGAGSEAGAYLEVIQSKADQLEGMIDELLDFERVDTGEWRDSLSELELGTFLRAFVKRVEADAALLGRRARGAVDLPEGLRVRMDGRLVTRALENLAFNALRYTHEGGSVEIAARREGAAILVTVADDGMGIAEADLPHVFEPFYRGTSSRREQGMGLGLSIVKTVVESHGWGISVQSWRGNGSVFTITIPAKDS